MKAEINEREALRYITSALAEDRRSYERIFDKDDRPKTLNAVLVSCDNAIRYIETKVIELNEREFPNEMAIQPETPFISDN